jgi:hypothetical protein
MYLCKALISIHNKFVWCEKKREEEKSGGEEGRMRITDVEYQTWHNTAYVKMTFYCVLKFLPQKYVINVMTPLLCIYK